MAFETNFQGSQDIKLLFGNGAKNLGTAHGASDQFDALPVVSFSLPANDSAALEVASPRSGTLGQVKTQGKHRRDLNTWTFDVSFKGTPSSILKACLWAFGDGGTPCTFDADLGMGNGTDNSAVMNDGTSYANAATVVFIGAGSDATANDIVARGCMAQSVTFKEDIGSEGGQQIVDITFWTGYPPVEENNAVAADTTDTGTPKSIFAKTATLDAQELMLSSWELTLSRSLERIGSKDYSNFLPFGYAQTGPWEVTGSLSAKRDDSVYDFLDHMTGDSTSINLSIDESSGYALDLPDVMIEGPSEIDNGGAFLMQNIAFRAFAASMTDDILTITVS